MNFRVMNGTAMAAVLLMTAASAMAADTLDAGGGASFTNYQPSLGLNQGFAVDGAFPVRPPNNGFGGVDGFDIGFIRTFASTLTPGGQSANGVVLNSVANSAPAAVIGNSYGGNLSPNFSAPNLGGVTIIGATSSGGQGALDGYQVGQTSGSATVTLGVAQLPAHDHTVAGGGSTGMTGGGAPFGQLEPSLSMTYLIDVSGIYPGLGNATAIGQVAAFAGSFVPTGWRAADGSLMTIASDPLLYGLIGTTFGGDGITSFALPDLRGRTIVGAGAGPGLDPVTVGESFGSSSTVLTLGQMAAHDHGLPGGGVTGVAGGATPVSNAQPSLGLNYLVAVSGVYPSRDTAPFGDQAILGEVVAFADTLVPDGFLPADGRLLQIAQYSALFSLFGTTYGGNGNTTFALPDLRGRVVLGAGGGVVVGQKVGTEATVLTEANLPAHSHTFTAPAGVPEPATWTMLILGLGLAGAGLRRRATTADCQPM